MFELTTFQTFAVLSYWILANMWAVFAVLMDGKFHPGSNASVSRIIVVYVINVFCFPLALPYAIYQIGSGAHDQFFLSTYPRKIIK